MDSILTYAGTPLELDSAFDRGRLVRFCAAISGSAEAAEDLAQDALLEAWRLRDRRRPDTPYAAWLFGVARNLCLRWRRQHGRDLGAGLIPADETGLDAALVIDPSGDEFELELERDELARLLDRALALLPPLTREVLIGHYVEGSPHADLADRLGLSLGAVAVRIHRGKLALRQILEQPDFVDAAESYGLAQPQTGWQETRIWCHLCGQRHYVGQLTEGNAEFTLLCPACHFEPFAAAHGEDTATLLAGIKGFKPAFNRFMGWANDHYRRMLDERTGRCPRCGSTGPLYLAPHPDCPPHWQDKRGVYFWCPVCQTNFDLGLTPLVLWTPEGRRFWKDHPRIRTLPEREIEYQGRDAVVTSFESITGTDRFEVISASDTFEVLAMLGPPPATTG